MGKKRSLLSITNNWIAGFLHRFTKRWSIDLPLVVCALSLDKNWQVQQREKMNRQFCTSTGLFEFAFIILVINSWGRSFHCLHTLFESTKDDADYVELMDMHIYISLSLYTSIYAHMYIHGTHGVSILAHYFSVRSSWRYCMLYMELAVCWSSQTAG